MNPDRLPGLLLAALLLIVISFVGVQTDADSDLWGNVRFGQDILAARSIPEKDPYSFTSDRRWVNHEWLAEVLFAVAYDSAGSAGLIGLRWALVAGMYLVVWRSLKRAGVFRPLAVGLLLVTSAGTYAQLVMVRPQLFSVFFFALLLALMNGVARGRTRLVFWVPALFAVWANLHGGWIVGAGVLGLWSACSAAAGSITWRTAAAGIVLALLGSLATPYGLELWRLLWDTVGIGRADIAEWDPLVRWPAQFVGWGLTVSLLVVVWRRHARAATLWLLPALAMGLLAFRVVRLEGFFTLATVILLAPWFAGLGPQRLPLSRPPTCAELAAVGSLCLVGVVGVEFAVLRNAGCIAIEGPGRVFRSAPEAEAITFLRDNPIQGRLLTYFDYGHMAIWHLAPKLRVSYDGRRETVYSEAVQKAHLRFYAGTPDAGYAAALKADYIWLPLRLPVVGELKRVGWVEIFRGPRSVVLAQEAGPYAQPAPWTGPRCFPGP